MTDTVNIICMKWGEKYDSSYVNKLFNMVSRNLDRNFRFICLTDDNSGFLSSIESFDLPKLNLPDGIPERGWTKLVTFSENLFDIQGQCLFLDLDLIIVNRIDELFELEGDFFIIKEYFQQNFTEIQSKYRNEQEYLSDYMKNNHSLNYWPIEWCQSFKKNCVQKGFKQFFYPPLLPQEAKIIIFHGKPNPPDALKGKSGKWYRKVLPTDWVADHWR